jgi:hypothetical protein
MAADSPVTTSIPPAPAAPTPAAPPPAAPPKKPPPSPQRLLARLARLDAVLLVLVVAAAFLLASFPAANSDVLQHFAVGRLLVEGKYHFGEDPFTFTTEGIYWANHSWLYDLITYGLYSLPAGGVVLVVVKGLLVVLLAVVMLRTSWRPGERWWVPATLTALAVLALSPQLNLRPVVVSFLFLGLTLRCLTRPGPQTRAAPEVQERKKKARPAGVPVPFKAYWPLPVLCLLWVNLDQWFFLGPLTVALYLAGVALQDRLSPLARRPDEPVEQPKTLGLVLLACVAACLVNPHHVHAFVLPPQLGFGEASEAVRADLQFQAMFLSPLSTESATSISYFHERIGWSIAGMAYFPLLLLGLLSFVLVLALGACRLWRTALWLFFAGLSIYHARAIPFFAVVAAPITALNFLDYAALRFAPNYLEGEQARAWAVSGRVLTIFLTVLLIAAAVPGWTQARPHEDRHLGWGVNLDPSLERAARQVAEWRKEGKLPEGIRWFNTSPDVVNYFAWFCPGEKGFLDQRLAPFDRVAADYVKARKAFPLSNDPLQSRSDAQILHDVFDEHKIDFVACYEFDMTRPQALPRLLGNPDQGTRRQEKDRDQWLAVYRFGRAALFRRVVRGREQEAEPFRSLLEPDARQAFGPEPAVAPRHRPGREPQPHEWYESLWKPPGPPNPDLDEAWMHFHVYAARLHPWSGLALEAALAASFVTQTLPAGLPSFKAAAAGPLMMPQLKEGDRVNRLQETALGLRQNFLGAGMQNLGPPESLYLAIRAARRALQKNPDESRAYLLLGKLYMLLQNTTREGRFSPPELREIRVAQICGALQQAVRLNPDLIEAHDLLANVYQEMGYIDLVARHRREQLRCMQEGRDAGRRSGEEYAKVLQQLEQLVPTLEAEVQKRKDRFEVSHSKGPPSQQARWALEVRSDPPFGLAETALDALTKPDLEKLRKEDPAEMRAVIVMQIDLRFVLGHLNEIREGVKRKDESRPDMFLGLHPQLPVPLLDWYRVRLAAASGDYEEAGEILRKLQGSAASANPGPAVAMIFGDILLQRATRATGIAGPFEDVVDVRLGKGRWEDRFHESMEVIIVPMRLQAELAWLHGWLALEAGDNKEAAAQLHSALALRWPPPRWLPLLLALGATSPVDVPASMLGSVGVTFPPLFDFNGSRLSEMGLEWLQEQEK